MSRVYPILFNTAMVQALLAGRKSCTRRIVKPQPPSAAHIVSTDGNFAWALLKNEETHWVKSAYDVGDILWVRETWCEYIHNHVIDGFYLISIKGCGNKSATRCYWLIYKNIPFMGNSKTERLPQN